MKKALTPNMKLIPSKKLEALVARHAKELHGSLFTKVATDNPGPPVLLGVASLDICEAVVRRIVVNAINEREAK
jgi:hypothetical protein